MVYGPINKITFQEVRLALWKMKCGKAMGPSGVVEMLVAAGDVGVQWMVDLCNAIVQEGKVTDDWCTDWCTSWIVSVYKGKGDAMDCGLYRGIKLFEHALKVFERFMDARIRKIVKIDDMQFGCQSGVGTMDAIFIVSVAGVEQL